MDPLSAAIAVLLVSLLGAATGAVTGLAPGLHVNNVAALILATKASWIAAVGAIVPSTVSEEGTAGVLLACYLLAAASSHAVMGFVPSVFFGAPTEETALALLPGHRLLLRGRGPRAVALAARGSVLGAAAGMLLLVPLRLLLADPVGLATAFRPWAPVFLLLLLAALLASEARSRRARWMGLGRASVVQLLAAALGILVLRGSSPVPADAALFPLFAGLFGLPNLIVSLRTHPGAIPPQRPAALGPLTRAEVGQAVRGAAAGAAVSWLPGLSGGAAATLAAAGSRRTISPSSFMTLLGAVSTSTTILSVAVLFIIGRTRSGAAVAVRELIGWPSPWADVSAAPAELIALLVSAALAVACAAPLAAAVAELLGPRWSSVDPRKVSLATIAGIGALLAVATGPAGLALAGLAALVGLVPVRAGVRRVHLMAALLVPVLLGYAFP